jgi:hypothetical protein
MILRPAGGTVAPQRGRGLGLLAEQHTLAKAATAGIERCFAANDDDNTATLGINRRPGYQPFASPDLGVKEL